MVLTQMFGYAGKILRVDLTKKNVQCMPLKSDVIKNYIGGTGVATNIIYHELPPKTPPLSPENKIVFATGPLTGTIAPMASRHVIVAKSPLTGLWGEADAGGFWSPELKFAGFDAVVIEGASDKPVFLWICDGKTEIREAEHLWGMNTYESEAAIKKELGKKVKVACIGQAGENLVKFAAIMNDGGRTAARSGLGAVMGSKKLKAIAVRGEGVVEVADEDGLKEIRRQIVEYLKNSPGAQTLSKYGTGSNLEGMLEWGNLPLKNWSQDSWSLASVRSISSERMAETIRTAKRACYGCPVGCEKVVQDESVLFNIKGRGPEYETLAALGSLCLNDNLEAIVRANDLCNRYGLDTIEAGATIAWAMECFEKKILSERDVGMKLKWGDGEAIIKLVDLMAKREGFGDILAEGVRGASQKVGGKSLSFAMHVKGSSICMHDPRVNPEMGLKYATLSMGAYHGKGCPYLEPKKDVAANVVDGQNFAEIVDSLVMCEFAFAAWAGGLPRKYIPRLFSAVTGRRAYWKLLNEIGQRIYNMKRSYITELGISKKDDNLPKRFTEILRIRGGISHSANIEPILPEYYKIRGWDERGVPTKERLKELKITPLK